MANKLQFAGKKVKLGDVCKAESLRNKDEHCGSVYSVTNSQGFIPSEDYFSKEVFSKDLKTYRVVERNRIAYNPSRINVGSVALQDKADEVIVSPLYVVFSVDDETVLPDYIVRFLKSRPGLKQIEFQSIGTVRNNLKFKALCRMELAIPSLAEQHRRLDNLTYVQDWIDQCKAFIDGLDNLVKSRFVEMFGAGPDDARYPVCKVEDIADVNVGVVIKPKRYYAEDDVDGVKAFRSLNVGEMRIKSADWVYFTQEGNRECRKSILKEGDVLVVRSGRPGTSCVVTSDYEGCNAVDLIIAHPDRSQILPDYLAAFNNSDYVKRLVDRVSVGSAQKHFNVGFYKELKLSIPPIDVQREYTDFVAQVDKSRFVAQQQIEKLQMLYDSLAQDYFG